MARRTVTINLDRIDDGARITLTYDLRGRDTDDDGDADPALGSDYFREMIQMSRLSRFRQLSRQTGETMGPQVLSQH